MTYLAAFEPFIRSFLGWFRIYLDFFCHLDDLDRFKTIFELICRAKRILLNQIYQLWNILDHFWLFWLSQKGHYLYFRFCCRSLYAPNFLLILRLLISIQLLCKSNGQKLLTRHPKQIYEFCFINIYDQCAICQRSKTKKWQIRLFNGVHFASKRRHSQKKWRQKYEKWFDSDILWCEKYQNSAFFATMAKSMARKLINLETWP